MLVELKTGETLNGHLIQADTWMNLTLKEVVQTSPVGFTPWEAHIAYTYQHDGLQDGDKFTQFPEVYVKGNNVCLCPDISFPKILGYHWGK